MIDILATLGRFAAHSLFDGRPALPISDCGITGTQVTKLMSMGLVEHGPTSNATYRLTSRGRAEAAPLAGNDPFNADGWLLDASVIARPGQSVSDRASLAVMLVADDDLRPALRVLLLEVLSLRRVGVRADNGPVTDTPAIVEDASPGPMTAVILPSPASAAPRPAPASTPRLPRATRPVPDLAERTKPLLPPAVNSRMAGARRSRFEATVRSGQTIERAAWLLGLEQRWLDEWAAKFPEWWANLEAVATAQVAAAS